MSDKITILIADDIQETRGLIRTLLGFEDRFEIIGEAANGEEAIELALKLRPDVILMDINMPVVDGFKATEVINMKMPETIIIIMSIQKEQEYLRRAMLCGAREYIIKPLDMKNTIDTILEVYKRDEERKNFLNKKDEGNTIKKDSKVISVFSTKGGVGKTTVAVNTAISLAKATGEKVAIVDLDLQFGDVASMVDLAPTRTIVDLVEEMPGIDESILDEYMMKYIIGIKILAAPSKPELADFIKAPHLEKIIEVMKKEYQYILIDTPTNFEEVTLTALDLSDKVLFVSTMDLVSIKNVKLGLEVMNSLSYSEDKVKLLINRSSQKFGIKFKELQATCRRELNIFIPEDYKTTMTAINKGYPFMRQRKGNKIYKSFKSLATKIIAGEI